MNDKDAKKVKEVAEQRIPDKPKNSVKSNHQMIPDKPKKGGKS